MDKDKIYVRYGNEAKEMIYDVLSNLKIEDCIDKNALIGIKPNLVVAKPSASGATTSPELLEGTIEYLKSKGFNNIVIMEGSWVGDRTSRAFEVSGYTKIAKKLDVPLIDLQKDSYTTCDVEGMKISVCEQVLKVDYLINMPVLKGHCQTKMTCALKNLKGCIPNNEKRRFHTMGLHKPIAYLNKAVKNHLIIVDGLMGDLDFEEGGNPVQMDRIIVGFDPVLIDSYVASLMGYDAEEIPYIKMAEDIGVGSCLALKEQIIELNEGLNTKKIPRSRQIERLARYVEEKDACSACYGSLIHALARLDEQGLLRKLNGKIHIGQGFKQIKGEGIGVGVCTRAFDKNVPGCPPTAKDIIELLKKNI
ncbi:MAG: DUF362 domain-containing protein [Thermoanaerobacteraceae bacterium]|nr:DUF362 domain-containing protein [Thermoanaerobacteraceae bacterium]